MSKITTQDYALLPVQQKFSHWVYDQFAYGGVKYASTAAKEGTDILVEDFGWQWLFGTQAKYVMRFKNTHREKDILKIATYFFIDWLKLGYHLHQSGTASIQCTTVPVKAEFFPLFLCRVQALGGANFTDGELVLDRLYSIFKLLRLERDEVLVLEGFALCENLWRIYQFDQLPLDRHESDTWNREDKK